MANGVDELEVFIAALRISFITCSVTNGSPESLRQGIEAFREALGHRSSSTTSPSPTKAFAQKRDHDHHSGSSGFAQAEDHISSASTVWSCDDRIDALTKQIELVNTEVREGTSEIRELIQSVKELKAEVNDLRSTLTASKPLLSSEVHPSSPTPVETAGNTSARLTLTREAQDNSSLDPYSRSTSSPSGFDLQASLQRDTPLSVHALRPPVTVPSTTFPGPVPATELPTPPPPSSGGNPVEVLVQGHSQTPAPGDSTNSAGPVYSVSMDVPGIVVPEAEDPMPTLSSSQPQNRTSQPGSGPGLQGEDEVAKTVESGACVPNYEATIGDDGNGSKISEVADPPAIATAMQYFGGSGEELGFSYGDKISILNSPNTPVGWMYGERVETRRGIFLARYVKETSDLEVQELLIWDGPSRNFKATEPSPGPPDIKVAVRNSSSSSPGELYLRVGDRITILDSPDTPDGWMYGEIAEKRRGIFPARLVALNKD
ncbi:hypothetical protein FS837_001365 [Tulasnella sp. UAMH 9824]|nr:hypothetical protein FS837_001365 [Tulasnella sp. UAMH 9824]